MNLKEYAEKNNLKLNPNGSVVDIIERRLKENESKFGKPYCPCRPRTGIEEYDNKIICPCVFHKEEIKREGYCHCRLFFKK
jgi:ferredoxin-thioredoxin reductase catalytic subunit